MSLKDSFKVDQIIVAGSHGDGGNAHPGLGKEGARLLDSADMDVFADCEAGDFLENAAQVGFIEEEMFCQRIQGQGFAEMLRDIAGDFFRRSVPPAGRGVLRGLGCLPGFQTFGRD